PVKGKADDSGEITPGPETGKNVSMTPAPYNSQAEEIPVKRSRKLATWHKAGQGDGNDAAPAAPSLKKSVSVKAVKADTKAAEKQQAVTVLAPRDLKPKIQTGKRTDIIAPKNRSDTEKTSAPAQGTYTIQVASYKTLDDALTQMVILDKKGIGAYRASVKIDGQTWYRVRIGSFADYKAARARLETLAGSGVTGMVIRKE
ncbi:MAG: SPOR domain-containing protein, partial [Desulfobacteraceae bacterium]|nr:SPOR domain-containing protein [Desulfobacteraceae bacterium]